MKLILTIVLTFLIAIVSSAQTIVQPLNTAFYFPESGATTKSVNHGQFWLPNKTYEDFFLQVKVNLSPTKQTVGSIVTSGYGGYHVLQLSALPCVNGKSYIYGSWNYTNSGLDEHVAIYSQELNCGVWYNIGFGYNQNYVNFWVDGVASPDYQYVTTKRRVVAAYETSLNIGGSGHSGCGCYISQVQLFEGVFPLPSVATNYTPEKNYIASYLKWGTTSLEFVSPSFLVDYSKGCNTTDKSKGFEGTTHPGKLLNQNADYEYNHFGTSPAFIEDNLPNCYNFR